jgi:hypothetical protein
MSQVSTNEVSLSYSIEASLGVLEGSPVWKLLEPNTIGTFGSEITTVAREPISKDRQRKKGTTTDLDSTVEFEADLTMDHFIDFAEGFTFANFNGLQNFSDEDVNLVTDATVTTDIFTVEDNGTLNPNPVVDQYFLVFVQGCVEDSNNGLHEVDTGGTTTTIPVTTALVTESLPSTAELSVVGYRTQAGDLDVDASGDLTSTLLDFTDLDLTVGQFIWVGGTLAINKFTNAANNGWARVTAITATKLSIDKKTQAFVTEANTTQLVDLFFGRFLRNVAIDDADFLERSFTFEGAFPDLGGIGTDEYEYARGNLCNEMAVSLPLTDKATVSFGFIGLDTDIPTASRESGFPAMLPTKDVAFNTSSDIARLRITDTSETEITSYFKNLTVTLANNVSPEKVLATLGAAFMNIGNFFVDIEAQIVFTDKAVPTAIRNNQTVTMDFNVQNDNGAIMFDIPSMTLGGGDKELPVNETVLMNLEGNAFDDASLGTSIGISYFPYIP